MNMQRRSEIRSIALHKAVAKKMRTSPELWEIPQRNLEKWINKKEQPHPAFVEWKNILLHRTREEILSILESNSEDAIRLRSSSPFTGILSEQERKAIFDSFKFYGNKQEEKKP